MNYRSLFPAPAALLLALIAAPPLSAQAADPPPDETTRAVPHRVVLSAGVGRPTLHQPDLLSALFGGTVSVRASLGYALSSGLEAGVAYEAGHFERKVGSGVSSTVHTLTVTAAVIASDELPVRPFLEIGPSMVVFADGKDEAGNGGGRATVAGATAGAGVRVRLTERVGSRVSASLLVADGPGVDLTRIFSGVHVGFTLGL